MTIFFYYNNALVFPLCSVHIRFSLIYYDTYLFCEQKNPIDLKKKKKKKKKMKEKKKKKKKMMQNSISRVRNQNMHHYVVELPRSCLNQSLNSLSVKYIYDKDLVIFNVSRRMKRCDFNVQVQSSRRFIWLMSQLSTSCSHLRIYFEKCYVYNIFTILSQQILSCRLLVSKKVI